MTADEFQNYLNLIEACEEAKIWAIGKTDKQAWERCSDPRWLFWWLFVTTSNKLFLLDRLVKANVPRWGPGNSYSASCWKDGLSVTVRSNICRLIRKNFKCPTL